MKEKNVKATWTEGEKTPIKKSHSDKKMIWKVTDDALRTQRLGITRNLRFLFWQGWYSSIPKSICESFLKENADFSKNAVNVGGTVYSQWMMVWALYSWQIQDQVEWPIALIQAWNISTSAALIILTFPFPPLLLPPPSLQDVFFSLPVSSYFFTIFL